MFSSVRNTKDTRIDIIVGEVKGGKNPLQFNDSLRNYPDRVQKLIRWIGAVLTKIFLDSLNV